MGDILIQIGSIILAGCGLLYLYARVYSKRLSSERRGENRDAFIRRYVGRGYDVDVLEAVYDSLQDYWKHGVVVRPFPLRGNDRIVEDLCIDPDEFCRVMDVVTKKCHRSWAEAGVSVVTVEDLLRVVQSLPEAYQQ